MGRTFMAAKVKYDPRATYLLPMIVGVALTPSTPLLLAARHSETVVFAAPQLTPPQRHVA